MNKPNGLPTSLSVRLSSITLAGLVLAAGCSSPSRPRDLMSEEANAETPAERPVAMRGEATFLEGKLAANVTITRGFQRQPSGAARREGGYEISGRDRRDDYNDPIYDSFGGSEEDQKRAIESYIRQIKAHRAAGSPMPPVTLRVQFENRGTEPLEVDVTDVNSDLGNFAVRPPKLTLAPGEKATLDPMISQLGVTRDEIPLQLAIRYQGKRETQVVPVKNIIAASLQK